STATWRRGRTARSPSLKLRAKFSLAFNSSSATDTWAAPRSCSGYSVPHRSLPYEFTRYNQRVNLDDTIVAIATPAGRGGIGVVRLAGIRAREIAAPMLRLRHDLKPGRAVFGE